MSTFSLLPEFDKLSIKEYKFSEFQSDLVKSVSEGVSENSRDSICHDLIITCANYYINKFTRNGKDLIVIYTLNNGNVYMKITRNTKTLIEILSNHIVLNTTLYGFFTQYWEDIKLDILFLTGDQRTDKNMMKKFDSDEIDNNLIEQIFESDGNFTAISFISAGGGTELNATNETDEVGELNGMNEESIEELVMNEAANESFESTREEVINRTYGQHSDHHFTFESPVQRDGDNENCELCYDKAVYQCSKCKYPMCKECVEKLRTSTGECPMCRSFPLSLSPIID